MLDLHRGDAYATLPLHGSRRGRQRKADVRESAHTVDSDILSEINEFDSGIQGHNIAEAQPGRVRGQKEAVQITTVSTAVGINAGTVRLKQKRALIL